MEPETRTDTSVNYFWRPAEYAAAGWGYCYEDDVEFYLAQGHEVKRVTQTATWVTEYLEPEND